ncbi:MAG: hypothetical protein PHE51_04900 [Eubacteriales bacterium]|nr:hypothetical protein [Eubacteriales bacterium]
MILTIKDRIYLLGLLPKESNFITLKIVRKLENDLGFSEDEIKKANIRSENNSIFWDEKKIDNKNIEIGEKATDIIIERLKELSNEKKLSIDMIELYEKFIKE